MRLRTRLVALVGLAVALPVGAITGLVSSGAERAFERIDNQRIAAAGAQVRQEFDRTGAQVVAAVGRIAAADTTKDMLLKLAAAPAGAASFVGEARSLAAAYDLPLLDLVLDDGTIVSSAAWPGRFGYKHAWAATTPADSSNAMIDAEDLPAGRVVAIMAARRVRLGARSLIVAGGRQIDRALLSAIVLPPGVRTFFYPDLAPGFVPEQLILAGEPLPDTRPIEALVLRARASAREESETVQWTGGAETLRAFPIAARGGRMGGVLVVGSSRRELETLVASIRETGLALGALGIGLGLLLSLLVAARVTRPIERLAAGARRVAAGNWDTPIDVRGPGEVGVLARAFHDMTTTLVEQRERLVQSERVAAWRELARRLAHELKNPLFPLRITVDNLTKARALPAAQFDEVFLEGTATLTSGLANLTAVIDRFSGFARMPEPVLGEVDVNDVVRRTFRLFDAQLSVTASPAITSALELDDDVGTARLDAEMIGRALGNLILNAIDAMSGGGHLVLRTRRAGGRVRLEVSDTGEGLTEEERTRLFTPYYTSKVHGTGLGLAIVQSVVSDHHGRVWVQSEKGRGTTFIIEIPTE